MRMSVVQLTVEQMKQRSQSTALIDHALSSK